MSLWFHRNMPPVPSGVFRHFLFVSDYWFFLLIMALFLRVGSRIFFLILKLTPPKDMSLEQCLDFIDTDELLEVTPKNLRIRKKILDPTPVSYTHLIVYRDFLKLSTEP